MEPSAAAQVAKLMGLHPEPSLGSKTVIFILLSSLYSLEIIPVFKFWKKFSIFYVIF